MRLCKFTAYLKNTLTRRFCRSLITKCLPIRCTVFMCSCCVIWCNRRLTEGDDDVYSPLPPQVLLIFQIRQFVFISVYTQTGYFISFVDIIPVFSSFQNKHFLCYTQITYPTSCLIFVSFFQD